ncbi:hypothetical protein [Streptomyces hydrogenans]|uniref:hypothetical protein n=1 Tax=Streptomyces hydrogenans TaxID=1873719 RepID=UPI00343295FB
MSATEILQRMEAALAARAEAIKPLAEIQDERAVLLRQLAALDEPYGKAYADAETAGWTAEELTELGIAEPIKRPKGRPRSRRPVSTKKNPQETASPAAVPAQDSTGSAAPVGADTQSG